MMNKFNQGQIEEKVLAIFHACRTDKDSPFEPSYFMDFLTHPPSKKHQIRNTFDGANKHGVFLRRIELEFGICFTLSDDDTSFDLNSFVAKIQERINKPQSNIRIIKDRMDEKIILSLKSSCFCCLVPYIIFSDGIG